MGTHLFWLGDPDANPPSWEKGSVTVTASTPGAVAAAVAAALDADDPERLLFWHADLGPPPSLDGLDDLPGEVWHAGLLLGQGGRPALMDFVHPTWMLQRDPPATKPASSWRLSLRACLARTEIWRRLGGVDASFEDLDAASLELGHRWWRGGALLRHVPSLLPEDPPAAPAPSLHDELRFLAATSGRFWHAWATLRAFATGERPRSALLGAWARTRSVAGGSLAGGSLAGGSAAGRPPEPLPDPEPSPADADPDARVAVLIPTLDRYPYLVVVLEQLRRQTVAPVEIVVIDQTAPEHRERAWRDDFADLPLKILEQDRPGQSTARNAGLRRVEADYVLFLDDDVEIEPDLVARHLASLRLRRSDASCGVTDEVGAGPLPADFRRRRLSDVFPTCNTMIRREVLTRSGLFDLAYDHGSRADADLGTRVYLSGGLMVLEPTIRVLHHKAPSGGLRRHGARVVTYADSRRRLGARHLPSATEIYLARRYFTPRQVREALLLRRLGTLKATGSLGRRVAKLVLGAVQWLDTRRQVRRAWERSTELLERYPSIPEDGP